MRNPRPAPPPGEPDDLELMARVAEGSEDAFAALVERHERLLRLFFRRLGADAGQAEDGTQDTFLKVWLHRDRYRPLKSFRAFLYTVARNVWYDRLRKARRSRETVRLEEMRGAGVEPVNHEATAGVERIDARADLAAGLETLPERMRIVLVLNAYQGLSYPEIADVLGIPVGTVKTRVFYALRRLREFLESHVRSDAR